MRSFVRIAYPTSDKLRQRFLRNMYLYVKSDIFDPNLFDTEEMEALKELHEGFPASSTRLKDLDKQSKDLTKDHTPAIRKLEQAVRDAWRFAKKATFYSKKHITKEAYRVYGAKDDASGSQIQFNWILAAEDLLKSEPRAIAEGLPPLAAPSSEQLREFFDPALDLHRRLGSVNFDRIKERDHMKELRVRVDRLYKDLYTCIRHKYRDLPPSTVRQTCRGMGFRFYAKQTQAKKKGKNLSKAKQSDASE